MGDILTWVIIWGRREFPRFELNPQGVNAMTKLNERETSEDLIDLGAVLVETKGSQKQNFDGTQVQLRDPIGMFGE